MTAPIPVVGTSFLQALRDKSGMRAVGIVKASPQTKRGTYVSEIGPPLLERERQRF
jgi:hypothetical protein